MRNKYQWKECVSFWWLSPFGLPMDIGHFLACQETEAIDELQWPWHPMNYPTLPNKETWYKKVLWCSMSFRATYLHIPHLKGSLGEIMPALPIKYIVQNYKSSKNGDSDLEHIWNWLDTYEKNILSCARVFRINTMADVQSQGCLPCFHVFNFLFPTLVTYFTNLLHNTDL